MSEMLRVDLRVGLPRNEKGGYGNLLATIEIDCEPKRAWEVYRHVVDVLTKQPAVLVTDTRFLFGGDDES